MNQWLKQTTEFAARQITSIEVGLLGQLFDQADDVAFFVKNEHGQYVCVNESLAKRHGLKRVSDAIGKRPSEICPGDFGQVPAEQDAKVLRTGRALVGHLEMQWHRPHKPVWCLTTKLPIVTPDGETIGLVGFSRDVRVPVETDIIPNEFALALEFFEQNPIEIGTPSMLADRANMSLQRLARLTKRLFGLTPSQFIRQTRVATASRLLLDTDKTIADISFSSGFYDQSAFTRAFRAATGVTPSQFRQQAKSIGKD
ncbi:AraC family transcriptional regulator [Novipirellula sp. SH528]|uniref:AraC family transcriptional regulator n=1 Tax=Novipirellula sp. SH528 TaxID=3454466 RepID=UPI003F9EDD70